jgi:energy-converting hydrogenase Eha subunit C
MELLPLIGVALGVLVAVVLLCLASVWLDKRNPSDDYDERQQIVQGKANGLSLGVGLLYCVGILITLERQVTGEKMVEPYLLVFAGIDLMIVVKHTYCLIGNAALPLSKKPLGIILSYIALSVCGFVRFYWGMGYTELSLVGKGSLPIPNLLMGITALYLALAHTIQFLRNRKERE